MDDERTRLLSSVGQWFAAAEQVARYTAEAPQGPTPAEAGLLDHLPTEGRVLDLGCGAGRLSWPLAQRGFAVVGVDVSRPLLQAAGERCVASPRQEVFVQVDPLALPFAGGVFDAIVACKVYGYLPGRSTRRRYLAALRHLLRPGGRLLLSQQAVPPRHFGSYDDERHRQAAGRFRRLEPGDPFATADGAGCVHWFTPAQLQRELDASPLALTVWRDDQGLGGQGYLQLVVLERPYE
jgi:SAM-dependent methyltransferase